MRRIILALIFCGLLIIVGSFLLGVGNIYANTAGALCWALITPAILWGLKYENIYRTKLEKILRVHEPAIGFPDYEKGGIKHYNSRAGLPNVESLLSINNLKSVEILSITSYLLVLTYRNEINAASRRGVKFTLHVLDPDDEKSIKAQTANYRDRDIKTQIELTIKDLESLKGDITIRKYKGIIGNGIMILEFNDKVNPWIKVESISPDKGANDRHSIAWYKNENEQEFDRYQRELLDRISQG